MPQPPAVRRRRDGQPVQPRTASSGAQAAREPSAVIPAAAAAGTTAAVLAALATLPLVDAAVAPVAVTVAAVAVARAVTAILEAFDRAHALRRDGLEERLERLLLVKLEISFTERVAGDLPAGVDPEQLVDEETAASVESLVRFEVEREKLFQAKARARLEQDLPDALALEDDAERRAAVRKILEREQRYAEQRERAIVARVDGQVAYDRQKKVLVAQGVAGMFWRINRRLENCARCLALAGRIWPWTVLDMFHPPRHLNCGCGLWTPADAMRFGWATVADVATVDEAISMIHLLEAAVDAVRDPEGLWVVEAGA